MAEKFVHLHVHSEYSLLDGTIRLAQLPDYLKKAGMSACAVTDHNNMFGAVEFYQKMQAAGLQAIIGVELTVDELYHLVLLAENNEGLHNLNLLVSHACLDFASKPQVNHELLQQYHKGLIALSACCQGEIPQAILRNDYKVAQEIAVKYKNLFGENNFFIELPANNVPGFNLCRQQLIKLAQELNLGLVATCDAHYLLPEDREAEDILLCLQTNSLADDPARFRLPANDFYLRSPEEMIELYRDCPEAIENTLLIAKRCQALKLTFGKLYLPEFQPPAAFTSTTYLQELAIKGLNRRLQHYSSPAHSKSDYLERLNMELGVINSMGYTDYYLIVQDFVNYAKSRGIPVGPGRGSGAASLVAYALNITDIDPLEYNLLFERFLNPERVSMPDFDIDFCYERRQEVIDYVTNKYGKDHVCQVIAFGTLAAKACLKDILRVFGKTPKEADTYLKLIPNRLNITLKEALNVSRELKMLYEQKADFKRAYDIALKLEGLPRHTSTHAAGVIICGKRIADIAPLTQNDGTAVVQYNKDLIEDVGLLKFDFLGLRTLTVIAEACRKAEEKTGTEINFSKLGYADPAIYEDLSSGKTAGVFQLESSGMTAFMQTLKPENLEDIIAGISLYRPGPMQQIPDYVKARHDSSQIKYLHPLLKKSLSLTYGAIVYQEQVMQIVRDLAGFSLGQSDIIRRAMAKKKPELLQRYEKLFIYGGKLEDSDAAAVPGAINNGVPEEIARKIYTYILSFAGYAFNKAHAAGYAVLAYQTAWLKHYYPCEFMTALLNSYINTPGQLARYIAVCRTEGIKVSAPDLQLSAAKFQADCEKRTIRFALAAIKNVGMSAAEDIVKLRKRCKFVNLPDTLRNLQAENINRNKIESLIYAGALDFLPGNRLQKIMYVAEFLPTLNTSKDKFAEQQVSLFNLADNSDDQQENAIKFPTDKAFTFTEELNYEKEYAYVYFQGHPLDKYPELIKSPLCTSSYVLTTENDTIAGKQLLMYGWINKIKRRAGKQQADWAILQVEDYYGDYDILCFAKTWQKLHNLIKENEVYLFSGKISGKNDFKPSLILQNCEPYTPAALMQMYHSAANNDISPTDSDQVALFINLPVDKAGELVKIARLCKRYPGKVSVYLYDESVKHIISSKDGQGINLVGELLENLINIVGLKNLSLRSLIKKKEIKN